MQDGSLVASNAKITGEINATSGKFKGEIEATSGVMKKIKLECDPFSPYYLDKNSIEFNEMGRLILNNIDLRNNTETIKRRVSLSEDQLIFYTAYGEIDSYFGATTQINRLVSFYGMRITNIPTSSANLVKGDVYRDGSTLKIVT
jgi:hypothetical protein